MADSSEKQRIRVLRACEGCKVARRKCNGTIPCEHCVKKGIDCVYSGEIKKRGPKKGVRKTKLQKENERLKAELKALRLPTDGATDSEEYETDEEEEQEYGLTPTTVSRTPASTPSVYTKPAAVAMKNATRQMPAAASRAKAVAATLVSQPAAKRRPPMDMMGVDNSDTMSAAAAILTLSNVPDPHTLLQSTVWQLPGPIIPSAEEEALLRTFFEYANQILPVVDENYFYAALEEAQFYPNPETPDPAKVDFKAPIPISLASKPYENPINTVTRNSEVFGFRVCYYTLLCMGAKVQGRYALAKRYYELARAFIGPCFSQPSQHLVSALLLMTMITRSICADVKQAALHAVLAHKMADLVEVGPDIRMVARIFVFAHSPSTTGAPWPEPENTANLGPHDRYADIMGFTIHQLVSDFPSIATQQDQSSLARLLDEAVLLHTTHGIMKSFPLKALVLGISALLHSKFRKVLLALERARECIELAVADKLSRYCFPVIFCIAKLMPVLREIMTMSEFGQAAADRTKELSASACSFLKESRQTIEGCPKLAEANIAACCDSTVLAEVTNSSAETTDPTSHLTDGDGGMVAHDAHTVVRPTPEYERKRKLPSGVSDSLRSMSMTNRASPATDDVQFEPKAMMRISAAMAPRASTLHTHQSTIDTLADVSSHAIIPGLMDDNVSSTPMTKSKLLQPDPRAFSPTPSFAAFSVDSRVPKLTRMTSIDSSAFPTSGFDIAETTRELQELGKSAYGDVVLSELDREERQAMSTTSFALGKGPAEEEDDRMSVTSLGLRLHTNVEGLLAGLPTDLSALETY